MITSKLDSLSRIRMGVATRSNPGSSSEWIHQLRLVDFGADGRLAQCGDNFVQLEPWLINQHKIAVGDVILCNREARFEATCVTSKIEAIAGSQMLVISPYPEQLLPEYLCWWLNLPNTARAVADKATGTYNRVVPSTAIRELNVPLPSLKKQSDINAHNRHRFRENELLAMPSQKREALSTAVIFKALAS